MRNSTVKQRWKPVLLLMVLAPVLAEVISGGTPITQMFLPWILVFYVVFLYGFQVLVIREVAVRGRLGPLGLWCLGAVYGLYNEGLRAQTLFPPVHSPVETFADYGLVAGVRIPFTMWIISWHGLFSVVIPVLVVEYLFPARAGRPWLPRTATWILGIFSVATAAGYFLFVADGRDTQSATTLGVHLAFVVTAALVLGVVATALPRTPRLLPRSAAGGRRSRLFATGAALFLVVFLLPELLAEAGVPWPLFVAVLAVLAAGATWAVTRRRAATREQATVFVLGCGSAQAALSVVLGLLDGNIMWTVSGAGIGAIFIVSVLRMSRKESAHVDHLLPLDAPHSPGGDNDQV
ncbi:MAG: hypothetical protein V7603_2233 [Micromonosporaceae bacterium]